MVVLKFAGDRSLDTVPNTTTAATAEVGCSSEYETDSEDDIIGNSIQYVLDLIKDEKINNRELNELCGALGRYLNKSVYEDSKSLGIQYRQFGTDFLAKEFLKLRPHPLLSFLRNVTND